MKSTNSKKLLLFCIALLAATGATPLHAQSALDGFDPNANGAVYVVVAKTRRGTTPGASPITQRVLSPCSGDKRQRAGTLRHSASTI